MLVQQEKEKLTRGFYKSNELAVFFIEEHIDTPHS